MSYVRDETSHGPTKTKTVMTRFEQRLRGVLGRINARIREALIDRDIFGMQTDTLEVDDPPALQERSNPRKIAEFVAWLREQLDSEFLTVVSAGENQYIRKAFVMGVGLGTRQLQDADVDLDSVDVDEIVESGRFDRGLQTLFTRTLENLKSLTDDIVESVREELLTGFQEGRNPREIARNITDRVDKVGKHRATLIARTEIINAHTEGSLQRYEQAQESIDGDVMVRHVGRLTAKDEDVCLFCRLTEDNIYTIPEFRSTRVLFNGTVYRLAPPSHPNGRCTPIPEIGFTDELPPLEERLPGSATLVS